MIDNSKLTDEEFFHVPKLAWYHVMRAVRREDGTLERVEEVGALRLPVRHRFDAERAMLAHHGFDGKHFLRLVEGGK